MNLISSWHAHNRYPCMTIIITETPLRGWDQEYFAWWKLSDLEAKSNTEFLFTAQNSKCVEHETWASSVMNICVACLTNTAYVFAVHYTLRWNFPYRRRIWFDDSQYIRLALRRIIIGNILVQNVRLRKLIHATFDISPQSRRAKYEWLS